MNPIHIVTEKENIKENVLLPGDPLRAQYIAEKYLKNPKLINNVRNMLGYTGTYKGKEITVIGSGMGIPSASLYTYELYKFYNVKNIIRIGSAGALSKDLNIKDIVLASSAYSDSNFRYALTKSKSKKISSSNSLNQTIINTSKELGINITKGTKSLRKLFPAFPVILSQSIFNGNNRKFIDQFFIICDHFRSVPDDLLSLQRAFPREMIHACFFIV